MRIRYYIAIFFVMISSVVYGPRVDLSDGPTGPTPAWAYFMVIISLLWIVFVYMREDE
tara:strand:+ start:233 stop:406 length:174 start_codon:yes stop_codon:yes gene_type:complete